MAGGHALDPDSVPSNSPLEAPNTYQKCVPVFPPPLDLHLHAKTCLGWSQGTHFWGLVKAFPPVILLKACKISTYVYYIRVQICMMIKIKIKYRAYVLCEADVGILFLNLQVYGFDDAGKQWRNNS